MPSTEELLTENRRLRMSLEQYREMMELVIATSSRVSETTERIAERLLKSQQEPPKLKVMK